MDRIKAFINGRFQNSDGEVLIKINPVSGAPIAEVEKTMDMDTPDVNTVVPAGSKSVGASETWGDVQVKGKFVRGALKALRSIDPLARVMTSDSQSVRKYGARLAENPLELEGFKGMSVEQVSKTRQSMLFNQGMMVSHEQFDLMRKSGVKMRRKDFNDMVSKEVRNPGTSNNQYAKAAADAWVEKTYKPFQLPYHRQISLHQ